MIFLQEKSIPIINRALVYGNPNASKVSLAWYFPLAALYYIIPIVSLLLIYLYIKKKRPFNSSKCPSCRTRILRIKRNKGDYIISILLLNIPKLRRYKCKRCKWQGLRVVYPSAKRTLSPLFR